MNTNNVHRVYALVLLFPIVLLLGGCSEDNLVLTCGNEVKDIGETCDGDCPTGCSDGNPCTSDTLYGSPENCNVVCHFEPISTCWDGDWCCPEGCSPDNDVDCSPYCGNGRLDTGETCDSDCPTDCNDGNPCTIDILTGSASNCSSACSFEYIAKCTTGDGCCPQGCSTKSDDDCSPSCGNEVIESGETCDPPATCPGDCDDGDPCTSDQMTGSAENCNAECTRTPITQCTDDDGCCLAACNANIDNDCDPFCGNAITEEGETCDGDCPTVCNDGDPCTIDVLNGNPDDCDVTCGTQPLTECINFDLCCPPGCNHFTDADCEVCNPGFHACDTGCCPWEIHTVDAHGTYSSIVIDSSDTPHIAYDDLVLKYARLNGGSWDIQTVDSLGDRAGGFPSMALDTNDNPHIASQAKLSGESIYEIRYAVWNTSSWDIQTAVSLPQWVHFSLALDSGDHPHISYYDIENMNLNYATSDGSGWDLQLVDGASVVGMDSSIALDSNDIPHISYLISGLNDLRHAYWNVDGWDIQTVDSLGYVGRDTSIKMDPWDRPCISYYDFFNEDLKFARWNGSSWDVQIVDADGSVGEYASLALDSDGNPHITYLDGSPNSNLKYARWNGSVWEIWVVETAGDVGWYPSLDLDSNNNPHISYVDYVDGIHATLKYATW